MVAVVGCAYSMAGSKLKAETLGSGGANNLMMEIGLLA